MLQVLQVLQVLHEVYVCNPGAAARSGRSTSAAEVREEHLLRGCSARSTPWRAFSRDAPRLTPPASGPHETTERMLQRTRSFGVPDNVWMGVSVENSAYTTRIDHLREVLAKVRFLSVEPFARPNPDLTARLTPA